MSSIDDVNRWEPAFPPLVRSACVAVLLVSLAASLARVSGQTSGVITARDVVVDQSREEGPASEVHAFVGRERAEVTARHDGLDLALLDDDHTVLLEPALDPVEERTVVEHQLGKRDRRPVGGVCGLGERRDRDAPAPRHGRREGRPDRGAAEVPGELGRGDLGFLPLPDGDIISKKI